MASSIFTLLIFTLFLLLNKPRTSSANLHKTSLYNTESLYNLQDQNKHHNQTTKPTLFFEVTKPIKTPDSKPCSTLILQHDFGFTYGKPPVTANYNPPSNCSSTRFSKVVLEWKASCKGRQFDRIFGVWLDGVELLRSCSAEPRATGIVWKVEKDVTKYHSLLMRKNLTLAVYLGNVVDSTYTGVYHVNLTFHFYPIESRLDNYESKVSNPADLILPISRNMPLNDGLWFEIVNSTDVELKKFTVPRNVYRAVLEVYVSPHENDEFWYGNLPNDYISANNLTGTPGNGAFREVLVSIDDDLVGAVWPFTVIYTGGINPLLWRPVTAIGSFDLPTYDIELTPFLGKILDGEVHKFGFSVTNALNVWYVDANLHLWLDSKSTKTEGKLLRHKVEPPLVTSITDFNGLDGNFLTTARRSIVSTGWVKSSYGKITTDFVQSLSFSNGMVMGNEANMQIVNQSIFFNTSVVAKVPSSLTHSILTFKHFPLYMYSNIVDHVNGSYVSVANLSMAYNVNKFKSGEFGAFKRSLVNKQSGQGSMVVKGNLVQSGLGSTQQDYRYDSSTHSCYFRNISSSNYTILSDEVGTKCGKKTQLPFGIVLDAPLKFSFS